MKPKFLRLSSLLFSFSLSFHMSYSIAANERDILRQIRENGVGRFLKPDVTYKEALALYPDAVVSVELGNPATMWRKNFTDTSETYFFVFREHGDEIFRAPCHCKPIGEKDWQPYYSSPSFDKNEIILHPIATNPMFSTDRGIKIGSKVSELQKAYPELQHLTAIIQSTPSMPGEEYEFLCFDGRILDSSINSIHSMNFYVRPAPGKHRVGKYVNKEYTTTIDSNAIIVGIQPHGGCLLNAVSPD